MPPPEISYVFSPSNQGSFFEIYFPKRAAYYGTIFDALRLGYEEDTVKEYLRVNVVELLDEFKLLPDLFNPHRYTMAKIRQEPVSEQEALERIATYKSYFRGWSTLSVDGVFFDSKGNMIEEATQIVKIIFRFESSFKQQAIDENCFDVLRAILFWVITQRQRLANHKAWSKVEERRFIAQHKPWPKQKLAFVKQHYSAIAKETGKWFDDIVLFIFCYLIRNFWKEGVVKEGLKEDVIWATSFYDLFVNVVERVER